VVERRPGVMPPKPGPPPRQVSRRRIWARRIGALAALLVVALIVIGVVELATRTKTASEPTTTAVIVQPKPFHIIFPEGFTRRDMAHRVQVVAKIAERKAHKPVRLSQVTYLKQTGRRAIPGFGTKQRRLEGFLFPATYDFLKQTTSKQLVAAQLAAFRENWGKVNLSYARAHKLTPYDVLIIASMVERETLAPDERPLVAAVIYNRLKAGMPLGIDATIRYGLNIPGTESLHESQLASDNPYNTRKFAGLPPTPIGNPGLASMQAAAHPAKVDYLYFVRKPDKVHHYFTSSYQDFINHSIAYGYK
jgi:uncharacterized YceG family protein